MSRFYDVEQLCEEKYYRETGKIKAIRFNHRLFRNPSTAILHSVELLNKKKDVEYFSDMLLRNIIQLEAYIDLYPNDEKCKDWKESRDIAEAAYSEVKGEREFIGSDDTSYLDFDREKIVNKTAKYFVEITGLYTPCQFSADLFDKPIEVIQHRIVSSNSAKNDSRFLALDIAQLRALIDVLPSHCNHSKWKEALEKAQAFYSQSISQQARNWVKDTFSEGGKGIL